MLIVPELRVRRKTRETVRGMKGVTLWKLAIGLALVSLIRPNNPIQTSVAFAGMGYFISDLLIPRVCDSFIRIGLKGKDMSKPPPVDYIAEAMGAVTAITYLVLMIWMIPFVFFKYLVSFNSMADQAITASNYNTQYSSVENNNLFPHNRLAAYLSAVFCLQSTTLLGLLDDLFDIRWRHKFFLPAVASMPLLIVYYVDFSVTSVVIPSFVTSRFYGGRFLLDMLKQVVEVGDKTASYITGLTFSTLSDDYHVTDNQPPLLDLGIFYYVYMSSVSIFSPNSINIFAGINGLEVGQSVVLAVVFLLNDACYLASSSVSQAAYESHLFSVIFLIPFVGVSLSLLKYNWCPAKVFVGDTYCYFSGMVFAIVGILGHFSKTLLLFLLPQIVNFLYSSFQIFGILPCPRHRLPRYNPSDGLMYPSFGEAKNLSTLQKAILSILKKLHVLIVEPSNPEDDSSNSLKFSNMTLINLALVWFGPMKEDTLCLVLLSFQFVLGIILIIVRHTLGPWLLGYDNLTWQVK
ncbi:Piso0_005228 [Millerozyma farinosa CBS 7064]|uniref:UDP-N-acetylglucosamine--dolichyl-phosphate N-acetylglucosaminephosphotransferase n=1 Tax=Pichia sorbitophila (strain ATCC MYA-4447 / BCRC 22081 / CBS 7064 / NBRC 10061 / NRRL Y-12695) TaxID=559304 RepID=G8Y1L8_PICSO|nr:Piso0_005228 [Millerozyma farinosa CBS 7064]